MNHISHAFIRRHYLTDSAKKSVDAIAELDNYRCKKMLKEFTDHHLPSTAKVSIIWIDDEGYLSSIYCNVKPLSRLWILTLAWFQELLDIRIPRHDSKKKQ